MRATWSSPRMPNTNGARGRIALSGGGLRPHRTGRRVKSHVSCESARNLWSGPAGVKECGRNLRFFCVLWCAYRACRVPLGFGQANRAGGDAMAIRHCGGGRCWPDWLLGPGARRTAQDYPSRPVTLVVPYAAGGGLDVFARQLAQKLSERLGKPFVVENRPGAGTVIGASLRRARRRPTATRIMLGTSSPFAINVDAEQEPALRSGQGLRADRATPRTRRSCCWSTPTCRSRRWREWIKWVKAQPKPLVLRHGRARLAAAPEHGAAQDHDRHQHRARALSRRRAGAQRSGRRAHPDAVRASRRRCCRCCAPARCARSAMSSTTRLRPDGRTSRPRGGGRARLRFRRRGR